jgi:hypothetical protein
MRECLKRTKPILNETLRSRWWADKKRPVPLTETHFPYIALCIDSTSVPVYRPKAPFGESKIYFDGKNEIYALKKEVAVMASPPHYALFSQPSFVGSIHDFEFFKKNYVEYLEYLLKTTNEKQSITTDTDVRWGVVVDKGYTGPAESTPGLRKIALRRKPTTVAQDAENHELSTIRCPVERFFGRVKKLWTIAREVYRWDHESFDTDFDNCVLLTNEHITKNLPNDEDALFAKKHTQLHKEKLEKQKQKRKAEISGYKKKKKQKLTNSIQKISLLTLKNSNNTIILLIFNDFLEKQNKFNKELQILHLLVISATILVFLIS